MLTQNGLVIPTIDRESDEPLYMQIYEQVRRLILSGDLLAGSQLPPIRDLAAELSVSRITVSNAYQELYADGLVEGHVGRGTIICGLPGDALEHPMPWNEYFASLNSMVPKDPIMREMLNMSVDSTAISMACGVPGPDLYPLEQYGQAVALALAEGSSVVEMSPVEGALSVREAMVGWAQQQYGIHTSTDNLMMFTGSQQAIDTTARALVGPGDAIVVSAPTYMGALAAFRSAGARLISVPVDHEGMRTDILDRILARNPNVQVIYTVPTFHNPTGTTMSLSRRHQLIELSLRYGVPIIEDDPYSPLYFTDEPPPPPLKALDEHGSVIYMSSFSKILFPGIRAGWVVAPRPVMDRLTEVKQHSDIYSDTLTQHSIKQFVREGWMTQHIEMVRERFAYRRNVMLDALSRYAPEGLYWNNPKGGFYIWCKLEDGLSSRDLLSESMERGLVFGIGELFYPERAGFNAFRLNYSYNGEQKIEAGVRILGEALTALRNRKLKRGRTSDEVGGTCALV